jgi:hypothetical protein
MISELKKLWQSDRLGVLAVGSVAIGFLCWALPLSPGIGINSGDAYECWIDGRYGTFLRIDLLFGGFHQRCEVIEIRLSQDWFTFERLSATIFFFVLGAFMFFMGNRHTVKRAR